MRHCSQLPTSACILGEPKVIATHFSRSPVLFPDEPRIRSGTWEETPCEHRIAPGTYPIFQRSTEDSWCSGSDPELSSDGESDRSATSNTRSVVCN